MTREEAIRRIKAWNLDADDMEVLSEVIPELKESQDERIRQSIVETIKQCTDILGPKNQKRMLDWLEKQKESPKSADSIPSDCISDAKCENRWRKVGDSLPDNPREVLCKDEAGNYFIGRYYVGEGWEISNYDDEDKPHHLNPPVSKWIDFPSEKQKEQKPITINQDEKEFLADEITAFLCNYDKEFDGEDPVPSEVAEHFYLLGKQAQEQKPVRDIVPGDAIESCMLRYLQSAANRNDDIEIIKDTKTYKSELISLIEKEQKPAEVTINGEPISTKNQSVDIPLLEWSEEDEKMKDYIIHALTNNTHAKEQGPVIYAKEIAWLKSLHPQAKQEQKEQKDEMELGFIEGKVEGVRQTCQEIKDAMSLYEPKHLTAFESTFRDYINSAIRYCLSGEGYQQYIKEWSVDLLNLEKHKNRNLKQEKRPHWKPSEEQMEALSETIAFAPDTFKPKCTLMTLQDDLKKL